MLHSSHPGQPRSFPIRRMRFHRDSARDYDFSPEDQEPSLTVGRFAGQLGATAARRDDLESESSQSGRNAVSFRQVHSPMFLRILSHFEPIFRMIFSICLALFSGLALIVTVPVPRQTIFLSPGS